VFSGTQLKLRRLVTNLGFQSDWYLILLALVIGCVTAGGAIGFGALIRLAEHETESAVEGMLHSNLIWLMPLIPMVGALLCGWLVHNFAREAKGHGVPEVMYAIIKQGGRVRPRVALVKSLASACTIGTGGSAGAEGPIAQIGAAMGSAIGQVLHVSRDHQSTLLGCGVAAGIASIFNAPIAGIFFVLEILLRDFRIRTFTPIVIASVVSAGLTQAYAGGHEEGAYDPIFKVPAELHTPGVFSILEMPNYLVLGLVCAVVAAGFTWLLYWTEDRFEEFRLHPVLKPVVGALLVGLLGVGVLFLAKQMSSGMRYPAFFGNGYPFITGNLLNPEFYVRREMGFIFFGLLFMGFLKAIATAATLGSGGSGGIFAPSLFMGACAGGAVGVAVDKLDILPHGPAAAYALVGMAAVVAGTTHAPLTAILILFEITGDYRVILPIMLAAVIATVGSQVINRDSIYTRKLRRRGLRMRGVTDLTILRRLVVDQVPMEQPLTVFLGDPVQHLLDRVQESAAYDYIVVDSDKSYLGLVTGEDVRTALLQPEAIPLLLVGELMRRDLPTVTREETLDIVLEKFAHCDVTSLAVVEGVETRRKVLGMLTRRQVMEYYHQAIDEAAD
jgi:chloride channel protein, CIC family